MSGVLFGVQGNSVAVCCLMPDVLVLENSVAVCCLMPDVLVLENSVAV